MIVIYYIKYELFQIENFMQKVCFGIISYLIELLVLSAEISGITTSFALAPPAYEEFANNILPGIVWRLLRGHNV